MFIFFFHHLIKVLNFYNSGKGWLPKEITIEIVDYQDDKESRYERKEEVQERRCNPSTEASIDGSPDSCNGSDDFIILDEDGSENQIAGGNKNQGIMKTVESWTCYYNLKKFHIKFVLNEDVVKTARKIMTEESSTER